MLHIHYTTEYDAFDNTSDGLSHMVSTYSAGTWHFTSDDGYTPDLHHALLGNDWGGGLAYVGVMCRSDYGYGLTGSMKGDYESMDASVLWDMVAVSLIRDAATSLNTLRFSTLLCPAS